MVMLGIDVTALATPTKQVLVIAHLSHSYINSVTGYWDR